MKEERIIHNKKGESICKKCNEQVIYSEKFDAYYCEKCNLWLEEKYIDPLCKLCKIRPIRPLKKKKTVKKVVRIKWW